MSDTLHEALLVFMVYFAEFFFWKERISNEILQTVKHV